MPHTPITAQSPYCPSLTAPRRLSTREVRIGELWMGGRYPVRLQSMTTTDTMDTEATVAQAIGMIDAGCELVRITAPSKREAENLKNIRQALRQRGYNTPLVADIHFTPNAAEIAARIVEKVRINPGNYADKKHFEQHEYTDAEYQAELERIYNRFSPLVRLCRDHGTAMRIGTNHGSLSDRIMSRYGDTPEGMVESALEFVRICEALGYYDLVISMKASNPQVMVQAYRLLVARMMAGATQHIYPLHLGVTEAGDGEDGRIKSAMGIGALLQDGIGDTVRVSLTEPPENELPVADSIVRHYPILVPDAQRPADHPALPPLPDFGQPVDPYAYNRRRTRAVYNLGGDHLPRVMAYFPGQVPLREQDLAPIGHIYDPALDKWHMTDLGADYISAETPVPFMLPNGLQAVYEHTVWEALPPTDHAFPWFPSLDSYRQATRRSHLLNFVSLTTHTAQQAALLAPLAHEPVVFVAEALTAYPGLEFRNIAFQLIAQGLPNPLVAYYGVRPGSGCPAEPFAGRLTADAACALGPLLLDGLLDGVWLGCNEPDATPDALNRIAFGLLQAARLRITKTEYISCPSCGRTLFDLEETTAMIRARTEHLKGVKIGIMGCIVNGPGEMADADYGYVGSGPGTITLYRSKEVVERNVPSEHAVERLIALIAEDGRWIDRVTA